MVNYCLQKLERFEEENTKIQEYLSTLEARRTDSYPWLVNVLYFSTVTPNLLKVMIPSFCRCKEAKGGWTIFLTDVKKTVHTKK